MLKSVCVIGAGLAGGIVASTLAAKGHRVTLVELGDRPAPLRPKDEVWESFEVQAPFTRGSGIGGSSNFWHGGLTVLDQTDVDGRPFEGRARAPMPYAELRQYYERAVALMKGELSYALADIEAAPSHPVEGFDTDQRAFRLKGLLYPDRPFSSKSLIQRAQQLHGLEVVPNVEILHLANSGPRHVAYAQGVDSSTGEPKRFAADLFVLSAGGLGSPKILLRSTETCPSLGKLPIGKYITDHPSGFVLKAKLRRRMDLAPLFGVPGGGYKIRYGFVLHPDRLGDADGRNHILYLRPAVSMKDPSTYDFLKRKLVASRGRSLSALDIAYLLKHADLLFDAVNFKYGLSYSTRFVSGLVFAEQMPAADSELRSTDGKRFGIRWEVSTKDCRSLERFLDAFGKSFADQFESFTVFPELGKRLDSAGHHSGGCRMAVTLEDGVVDGDLRVFGIDNLHVADGSTLAYSGHANTGLTIAALALKCCDAVAGA